MQTQSNTTFHPRTPGLVTTIWYDNHLKEGKEGRNGTARTWSTWFIYYMEWKMLYCLYPNLPDHRTFAANWNELGVHPVQQGKGSQRSDALQDTWDDTCQRMPSALTRIGWDGVEQVPRLSHQGIGLGVSIAEVYGMEAW